MPRPWFISLTAKWSTAEHFGALAEAIDTLVAERPLPYYHLPIPKASWHSTVCAIAQITSFPSKRDTAEAQVESLLRTLMEGNLIAQLERCYQAFESQPRQLRCFDNGTTVQFADNPRIAELRASFRAILHPAVGRLCGSRPHVTSLLDDENKSNGPRFFGSIARSADPNDGSQLRWQVDLPRLEPLVFHSIELLISDDGLTNRHDTATAFRVSRNGA